MSKISRRFRGGTFPVGLVGAALGLALFVYFVRQAGLSAITAEIKNLGWGFLIIIGISAVRQVVRSLAWMMSMEEPGKLRFWDAFRARVMGDTIGNLVPLASGVISEPAKPALIRDRVPLIAGLSAIAIENIFYSFSVGLFIFLGAAALLLNFALPKPLKVITLVTVGAIAFVLGILCLLLSKGWKIVTPVITSLKRRGLKSKILDKLTELEDRIYGFAQHHRRRFLPIFLLEACFHMAGVAEVFVTLVFISPNHRPGFLVAFILESVNRVINLAFKFVPLRMGVDELGTGNVSRILLFTQTTGVTLAIIRKARDIFWCLIGMLFLLKRGFSERSRAAPTESSIGTQVGDLV